MSFFGALDVSASGLSAERMRMDVTAENLANAETPGFQRSDVDFHSALSAAMRTAEPSRIESTSFSPQTDSQTLRADGNGVDIDTESAAMAKNGLEYEALVSVAKARIGIIQSAMGIR